jgi:CRP/FNR family transcriptional regulator, cyclic AMP receptor protein
MPSPIKPFNIDSFLAAVHARRKIIHFRTNQTIFSQGEDSDAIFYIEKGSVKLTITSEEGREAIVGVFGGGDFFGESCIASDLPVRFHTAIAITDTRVVKTGRDAIINGLRHRAMLCTPSRFFPVPKI